MISGFHPFGANISQCRCRKTYLVQQIRSKIRSNRWMELTIGNRGAQSKLLCRPRLNEKFISTIIFIFFSHHHLNVALKVE